MKTTTKVGVATFLGFVAIAVTGYANYTTKSTVMLAEMLHSVSDTVGLCLLLLATKYQEQGRNANWVGKVSGYFLILAAILALFFGIPRLIALLGGAVMPIQNPFELLFASSVTLAIVWIQLKLTKNVHHLLHSHQHGSVRAEYFFGNTKRALHQTHKVTRTELYADLIQAACGVVMGLIAFYFKGSEWVRFFDVLLSIGLGFWMLWRGVDATKA